MDVNQSILAENSPYYEAGVKASYRTPNYNWYLAVLLLNGWQRMKRVNGNNTPSFGTQVTYTPTENLSINSSMFAGNDKPDSVRQFRYFHNLYSIIQVSKKLSFTTGLDIGAEQRTSGSSQINTWYSPIIIARYSASVKFKFAARAEYYRDRHGVIISTTTPNGFQTFGYSVNVDYAIQENSLLRIEARTLTGRDKIFDRRNSVSASSTWLTTSISLAF